MPSDRGVLARARESCMCAAGRDLVLTRVGQCGLLFCRVHSAMKVTVVEKLMPIRSGLTAVPVRGQRWWPRSAPEPSASSKDCRRDSWTSAV